MDKEIIEGNRLIAEFAGTSIEVSGWHNAAYKYAKDWRNEDRLFHSSWDWLMPVVEKIEGIGYCTAIYHTKEKGFTCKVYNEVNLNDIAFYSKENKIETVWLSIVEFIKWYNQINK